jgi:hypothetical protein
MPAGAAVEIAIAHRGDDAQHPAFLSDLAAVAVAPHDAVLRQILERASL